MCCGETFQLEWDMDVGEAATNRFKAETRPEVSGKQWVWNGQHREVAAGTATTSGNTSLTHYGFIFEIIG